jgi:hypothetical protein
MVMRFLLKPGWGRLGILICQGLVGRIVNVALEAAQQAKDVWGEGETDLPGHNDHNDRYDSF